MGQALAGSSPRHLLHSRPVLGISEPPPAPWVRSLPAFSPLLRGQHRRALTFRSCHACSEHPRPPEACPSHPCLPAPPVPPTSAGPELRPSWPPPLVSLPPCSPHVLFPPKGMCCRPLLPVLLPTNLDQAAPSHLQQRGGVLAGLPTWLLPTPRDLGDTNSALPHLCVNVPTASQCPWNLIQALYHGCQSKVTLAAHVLPTLVRGSWSRGSSGALSTSCYFPPQGLCTCSCGLECGPLTLPRTDVFLLIRF